MEFFLRQGIVASERFDKGACRYAQNSCGRTLRCTIQICENSKVVNRPESARAYHRYAGAYSACKAGTSCRLKQSKSLSIMAAGALIIDADRNNAEIVITRASLSAAEGYPLSVH